MSRLSIEIDPEQHRQIKILATFAGLSIKDYILQQTLPRKKELDATEHLLSSPANAQRLLDALNTPRSECVAFETMEDVQNALGI
jgi:uncharacterized protein (DUF1778 family)